MFEWKVQVAVVFIDHPNNTRPSSFDEKSSFCYSTTIWLLQISTALIKYVYILKAVHDNDNFLYKIWYLFEKNCPADILSMIMSNGAKLQ